ncbi:hypothetical protein LSH36_1645g00004 [Paralvinella palmiformis]|uniref:BTB domain-containing protein n=1 Tax=Paralvinella palmiformis TaxID=53620 RepID=A0AAD9IRL2_9ANNE|nr:hypothetical protein LSH36_1645g00004 [Paralvinella palmiformis]
MDIKDLFLSCRRGDLNRVQYLVEEKEVDLTVRDKWDSSPLYYACLCGHIDIVRYLLEKGAKCELKTFDGERCVYGALNDEIRMLLKNYKAVTSSIIRRDQYNEFLRRMLEAGCYKDISFIVHDQSFSVHRCVLAARCRYFADLFVSKWEDRSEIKLKNKLITPHAFKALLQFLYTARLNVHLDHVDDVLLLAKHCKMTNLTHQIEEKKTEVESFEQSKPGVTVNVLCLEPSTDSSELNDDLGVLADQAFPHELCQEFESVYTSDGQSKLLWFQTRTALPFPPEEVPSFPDVIFSVEGHQFNCHKVFFTGRSDYFKALLDDHFGESSTDEEHNLPVITLHETTSAIFVQVMYYIYQDSCELNRNNVVDILSVADMFLLPGLKRRCANALSQWIDVDNIITILRTARLFDLARLEDQCAEFIASNLERVIDNNEFTTFVREDANAVKERQETDSIPIVDDIRYHITNFVQTFSDMYEADQKLAVIDSFLEELGLEA